MCTIKSIFLIFFLFISWFGYSQTASVKEGCVPLEVNFQAPLSSSSYFWDFKDGVTSNLANPSNVFLLPGTYQVTFQESVNGPVLHTFEIIVHPDPVLKIAATSGCAPLNVQFTNLSEVVPAVTVDKYIWVFGDGTIQQGLTAPTKLYSSLGKFDVSLAIETKFKTCNKTVIFSEVVEVVQGPTASFSTTPAATTTCRDTINVSFTNTSTGIEPLTYFWDLGKGVTSTSANPPSQRYIKGAANASLTVSYPGRTGCTSTASKFISAGKPTVILLKKDDSVCVNTSTSVKNLTTGIHAWTVGPDAIVADITGDGIPDLNRDSIVLSFSKPGFHTITLMLTSPDGQCSNTQSVQIYADLVTAAIETTDPTFSCESPVTKNFKAATNQTKVKYHWMMNGKEEVTKDVKRVFISSSDTIYYDVNRKEEYTTVLTVTSNLTGCKATASRKDTVWLPNSRFMPSISKGCVPLNVVFSDSSKSFDKIVKWEWILDNGAKIVKNDSTPVSHTFSTPGVYASTLVVTTKKGCVDTSYAVPIHAGKKITFNDVDFSVSKSEICPGEKIVCTVIKTAPGVDSYTFTTDGRPFEPETPLSMSYLFDDRTGAYDVSLLAEDDGCVSECTKNGCVKVKGAIPEINFTSLCETPLTYDFKADNKGIPEGTIDYAWDFGDLQKSSVKEEIHTYGQRGDYRVKLTALDAASGCPAMTDSMEVKVRDLKANFTMEPKICMNISAQLDASASVDVEASCYKGYTWIFPGTDKRPVTSSSPKSFFSFDKSGNHQAILVVRDANGCTDTAKTDFKVYDIIVKPTVDKALVCNPADVQFTDLSTADTTLVSFEWNLGDMNQSSVQHPAHTYSVPPASGNAYIVELTVKDILGCSETSSVQVNHYSPVSSITGTPSLNICFGDSVTLSASDFISTGSHLTFDWDLGDGTTSVQQSNKILYKNLQDYNVTLNYTEVLSGCSGSTTAKVQIQDYPKAYLATPNIVDEEVLCAPQIVQFQDSSKSNYPLTYTWDFGNGQTSSLYEFYVTYPKGHYDVKHTVSTSFGCTDRVEHSYNVLETTGNFTMDRNTICKGEEITFTIKDTSDVARFTWAFGDGIVVDNVAPATHQYNFHPPSGQTFAKLVVEGFNGVCPVERQRPVFIREVIANFQREDGIDTSICFNDGPYHFTNTSLSADTYLWDFGDGQTSQVKDPLTHQYPGKGIYEVTLSIENQQWGCKDNITKKVVVFENPVVEVLGDTVCQGKTLQLLVTNPVATDTYKWTPSTGLSGDDITNPTSSILHSQIYSVTQTNTDGCTDTKQVPAIVIEPIGLQDWDTSIVIGDRVALPVYGPPVYIFTWTPTSGLSCLSCNYPTVQPLEDIVYKLNVQDKRGCWNDSYEFKVEVKPETFVKLPTLFTPDGDGANDRLYVKGWGIKELLEYQIFNRWGQLIYSSTDINEGWDGKFRDVLQNSDMYAYKVKVLTWRNEVLSEEGFVNLLH